MPLTDTQVRALKPRDKKKKFSDGGGLYVEVLPSGRKTFRLTYRQDGRQRDIRLGTFGRLRLAEARALRERAKELLNAGQDPTTLLSAPAPGQAPSARLKTKSQPGPVPEVTPALDDTPPAASWSAFAQGYLRYRSRAGMHKSTRAKLERQVWVTIECLGDRPLVEITAQDILALVRPIEDEGKVETAHEVRSRCAQIFDFAAAEGCSNTNPARVVVRAMLPRKRGKFPGLTEPRAVGELMRRVREYDRGEPQVRWGLLLSAYLFVDFR